MKTVSRFALAFILLSVPMRAAEPVEPEVADLYSRAELDQMLAPIALYPDGLLSQILMASTYPLEIVAAARWSEAASRPEGGEAVEAVADREWDPSVKALVAFPELLARMNEDLTWTQQLGDAFLQQEDEVMEVVQGLRQKAYDAGNLESLEHLRVSREQEVIVIEPANPRIIYVPYYQPTIVYGSWWWPEYPPFYWRSHSGVHIVWSSGVRVSPIFFYSRPDWHRRQIIIVHDHRYSPVRVRDESGRVRMRPVGGERRWRHEPAHRRGVRYRDENVSRRFDRSTSVTREGSEWWQRESRPGRGGERSRNLNSPRSTNEIGRSRMIRETTRVEDQHPRVRPERPSTVIRPPLRERSSSVDPLRRFRERDEIREMRERRISPRAESTIRPHLRDRTPVRERRSAGRLDRRVERPSPRAAPRMERPVRPEATTPVRVRPQPRENPRASDASPRVERPRMDRSRGVDAVGRETANGRRGR